jgi:hypothetical protein
MSEQNGAGTQPKKANSAAAVGWAFVILFLVVEAVAVNLPLGGWALGIAFAALAALVGFRMKARQEVQTSVASAPTRRQLLLVLIPLSFISICTGETRRREVAEEEVARVAKEAKVKQEAAAAAAAKAKQAQEEEATKVWKRDQEEAAHPELRTARLQREADERAAKEPVLTEEQKRTLADGQQIAARIAANVDKVGSGLASCVGASQYKSAKLGTPALDPSGVVVIPAHVEGVDEGIFSKKDIAADLKVALRKDEGDDVIRLLNPHEGWHCTDWTYLPGLPPLDSASDVAIQRRLAAIVPSDDKTTYKGGQLHIEIDDLGAEESASLVTIEGHSVLRDIAPQAFGQIPSLKGITVTEFATINDARGNPHHKKVAEFYLSRATNKKINWERITLGKVLRVVDRAWRAPGVAYLADDVDKEIEHANRGD